MYFLNKTLYQFSFLACFVTACGGKQGGSLMGDDVASDFAFALENPLNVPRMAEPFVLTAAQMEQMGGGQVPAGLVPVLTLESGEEVPSQVDDLNGDGQWDELAFLATVPPQGVATFQVAFAEPAEIPPYPVLTNIRLGKKMDSVWVDTKTETRPDGHSKETPIGGYQMEGPAWENDVVAFRTYFDSRNGKDIFGKKTNQMVLDEVGIVGDYHKLSDWGMDILKVNNSLGAGAIALYENGQLHRLTGEKTAQFEVVSEGAVRSVMRLIYKGWPVNGKAYDLTEEIHIWAGQPCYESHLTLSGFEGSRELATGIVKIHTDTAFVDASAGGATFVATHGAQAYEGENLGMAVMAASADWAGNGRAPETGEGVTQTFYVRLKATANQPVTFRFFAGWELQDAGYAQADYFLERLRQYALLQSNPLTLRGEM